MSGGIGSPALATESSNAPSSVAARTRTGPSGAPWVSALASRFESSCAMRPRSQRDRLGRARARPRSRGRARPARSSATTCSSTGAERLVGVAVQRQPAAEPAAREVQHVVDQPGHARDAALRSGRRSRLRLRRRAASRAAACAPASIEASGLRRSWPSTAMNCSRSSARLRARRAGPPRSPPAAPGRRGGSAIRSANSLNMPTVSGVFSRAGRGSMAHSVPKNAPSARRIGIEM